MSFFYSREKHAYSNLKFELQRVVFCRTKYWSAANLAAPLWRLFWYPEPGITLYFDDGQAVVVQPDRLYLIPAGVNFSGDQLRPLDEFHVLFNFTPELLTLRQPIYEFAVNKAFLNFVWPLIDSGESHRPLLTLRAMDVLSYCLRAIDPQQWQEKRLAPILWPVLQRMQQCLSERSSNRELAQLLGMSESRFIRYFTRQLGQSPQQYLTELKVMRAKEMLFRAEVTLDKIAVDCGFCDKSHFSRQFKRRVGVSPGQYRRQYLATKVDLG
ncbi:helix-turn-helix protein [Sinobacterium caligoides]|uniref:Helix-turn-helix protein n=1 Tax=Sinobacterium caligoides TaxID=933926 RepID=A0A3N2DRT0_9GAMM|nr:AraC family transcriptional regulator [Sinobacterium caligoides]ROS02015.1 helix-turn-helix protein [Sinobacterium caligoides]